MPYSSDVFSEMNRCDETSEFFLILFAFVIAKLPRRKNEVPFFECFSVSSLTDDADAGSYGGKNIRMIGCRFFDSALAKDCVPKKGGPRLVSKVQKSSKKFKKVQKSSKKFKKVQKSSKKFKKVQKSSML
jgi:hypothetical protein